MSSKTGKPPMRSAAWRISFWATVAFACGTLVVFVFLHRFVANDIQRRSDAWLSGEVEVLGDVAERHAKGRSLRPRGAEKWRSSRPEKYRTKWPQRAVRTIRCSFFNRALTVRCQLWVGAGDGKANLKAIQTTKILPDQPTDLRVSRICGSIPGRLLSRSPMAATFILGLSERDELRCFISCGCASSCLWLFLVSARIRHCVFCTTRRMLSHVREITEAASRIGHSDLNTRVPTTNRNDEVSHLARTLNRMLDRIESSMHQLHTITDSLAHDLRSPLTAIRGKLEMSLTAVADEERAEPIVSAIEELDRLTDFLEQVARRC